MSKTLSCGCIIFSAGLFKFCPLHDAAPDLLAALEGLDAHIPDREGLQPVDPEIKAFLNHAGLWRAKQLARAAIAKALPA